MKRVKVDSSTILAIGYDMGGSLLEVEFKNGGVYQYKNVPISVTASMMASESKGKFFHKIKGDYEWEKVYEDNKIST